MQRKNTAFLVIAIIGLTINQADTAEIMGRVNSVASGSATVEIEGKLAPNDGDKAEIFFKLAGVDEEVSVATATVRQVKGQSIELKIENATGEVAQGQLVRIKSARPVPIAEATAAAPPPNMPPDSTTKQPTEVEEMASRIIVFNQVPLGALAAAAFALDGFHFAPGRGQPEVFEIQPNMRPPSPCMKVLMVTGGPVTSLVIRLDPPVKRFALYRIGTWDKASVPTWKMSAYDANGRLLGTVGEEHGLPAEPKFFGIDAEGIIRVELKTDNRYGSGTWATWNSLPVAGFGYDR